MVNVSKIWCGTLSPCYACYSVCMWHVAITILYIAFVVGMHSQQAQDEALYAEFALTGLLP